MLYFAKKVYSNMQGYIIRINPSRDEDLIVTILTHTNIITCYRFYGARHANINLGYKIDAELIYSSKSNIPQLRNVLHLGFSWIASREHMLFWQNFMGLFHTHLRDIEELDSFYFELIDEMAIKLHKQNPKRLGLEAYVKLLLHEGRLHHLEQNCFLCEKDIEKDNFSLSRGFLPAHAKCLASKPMNFKKISYFLSNKSTILLDDKEVNELYKVLLEGL